MTEYKCELCKDTGLSKQQARVWSVQHKDWLTRIKYCSCQFKNKV